jgi:mannose-6-phosphate isomerase-like protein (cupin superfamily)
MSDHDTVQVRAFDESFRWEGVDLLAYKDDGAAPFRAVTRQNLFASDNLGCELRYFEVAPGGFSTLERHQHMHAVLVLRGHGQCLLGDKIHELGPNDLVTIPGWTWHQFRATAGEPLGFLCMVNADRDRPQLPSDQELTRLKANPAVAAFLRDRNPAGESDLA